MSSEPNLETSEVHKLRILVFNKSRYVKDTGFDIAGIYVTRM